MTIEELFKDLEWVIKMYLEDDPNTYPGVFVTEDYICDKLCKDYSLCKEFFSTITEELFVFFGNYDEYGFDFSYIIIRQKSHGKELLGILKERVLSFNNDEANEYMNDIYQKCITNKKYIKYNN